MRLIFTFLLVAMIMAGAFPRGGMSQTFSFATGNTSGTYYPYGGGLSSIWSKHVDGVNIKAEVTGASVVNIIQVARQESEVAIVQGDAFMSARDGTGKFPEKMPVSVLFAAYPQVVHLMTLEGSGINHVNDLKGRRVSLGAPGSGTAVTAGTVLKAVGIHNTDMELQQLSFSETVNALRDGNLDAGFIVASAGVAAVVELALTRDLKLVPFSDAEMVKVRAAHKAYHAFSIPVGTYNGIDEPVQTPSLWNFIITYDAMPEKTAYALARGAFEHLDALREVSHVARFTTLENTSGFEPSLFHPGALRYYREQGYFKEVESDAEPLAQ